MSFQSTRSLLLLTLCAVPLAPPVLAQPPIFKHTVVDADNPDDPHCKTLGDFDGDGFLDAVVASSSGDGMYWYEYPLWTKHEIRASGSWTTDMQAADIDDDGDLDVVLPNGTGLLWYENPLPGGDPRTAPWAEHRIGFAGANNHDVEVADVDGDGDLDVVSRRKGGNGTFLWRQQLPSPWEQVTISTRDGEGIAIGDIDGDGDLDVAQNAAWVEQIDPLTWVDHDMGFSWPDDVGVVIVDVDSNGVNDIVLAPSESSGRLAWFEATDPVDGPWTEHSVDPTVSFLHTFEAADMDFDGDVDLITAEMHQSGDPDEVSVYLNEGGDGLAWTQQIVDTRGSHNVRVGDVGNDADLDIFGANWNESAPNSAVVDLWENVSAPLPLDRWERHVLETNLPWQSVFVQGGDLSGDGLPDLAVGGWWYRNPGGLGGSWSRSAFGAPLDNLATLHDFDGDGDLDALGTDGRQDGNGFSWAENSGVGAFTLHPISTTVPGGDFLQGVSIGQLIAGGGEEVVLSWHNGAGGTSAFRIPDNPDAPAWPVTTVSPTTNSEQSPIGDVDGDGDNDVHLGDQWLRQEANGTFSTQPGVPLSAGVPDRVVLADIDNDGDLDVVIGVEFSNLLVWGENEDGDGTSWSERFIAADVDYFSVDAADVDRDGDIDVVGGAHMGNGEVYLYENEGDGASWTRHTVDAGDPAIDHHDGTLLVDMDLDGDLDVISVGWTRRSVVVYENEAVEPGADTQRPRLVSVRAVAPGDRVEVEFDEPVDPGTAEDPTNYAVSDGISVRNARLFGSDRTVTLRTDPLTPGVVYTLTVNDVEDLAGNPIAADTGAPFVYIDGAPVEGLVGHWPLDQSAGRLAIDETGNGRNGELENDVRWIGGPALDFGGIGGHVDVGVLDVTGDGITLSAWIRPRDLGNCSSSDCRIVSKATSTAEADHWYMLSTIASGSEVRLRFRLKTDGSTSTLIASSGDLAEGEWQHAVATYDGAQMRLYLDGVLVGSTVKTGSLTPNAGVPTWIGGNPPDAAGKPWAGRIDDVRIYDRALIQAEILALPEPSDHLFWDVTGPLGTEPAGTVP